MNPELILKPIQGPQSSYIISASSVAEVKVVEQGKMTNQEALRKITNFLDNATSYLRKKRLELPE